MHIDVFDTTVGSELAALKTLLARDEKDIFVEKIYTSACAKPYGNFHYVTVTYRTNEAAPAIPQIGSAL
jgi:hypothetical protein